MQKWKSLTFMNMLYIGPIQRLLGIHCMRGSWTLLAFWAAAMCRAQAAMGFAQSLEL